MYFFCIQDHLITLKVIDMGHITDQTYKLQLEREFGTRYNYYGYNSDFGNWFGLLEISDFSNCGNYLAYK